MGAVATKAMKGYSEEDLQDESQTNGRGSQKVNSLEDNNFHRNFGFHCYILFDVILAKILGTSYIVAAAIRYILQWASDSPIHR